MHVNINAHSFWYRSDEDIRSSTFCWFSTDGWKTTKQKKFFYSRRFQKKLISLSIFLCADWRWITYLQNWNEKKTVVALFRVEIHTSVTIAMFRIYYFTKFRRKCRSFVFFWKFVCITSKNRRQLFHLVLRSREIRNFMKFDKSIRYLGMQREHRPLGVTFSLIW